MTPANVSDINFTAKQCQSNSIRGASESSRKPIPVPSEAELDEFYKTLNSSTDKPAILKITPPYSKQFIPLVSSTALPSPMSQLYDPDALGMDYLSLIRKCEEIASNIEVSSKVQCHIC